jgi:hypothetical protein
MASNEPVDGPMLTVVMDGQAVIEYDRRKPLASRQRLFLDHMDRDMDSGFNLDGRQEASPDLLTRARFVATSLVQALEAQNDSVAAATCAYLALRLPALKQVRANRKDGQMHIDLVFDEPHVQTQTVHFVRPDGGGGLH